MRINYSKPKGQRRNKGRVLWIEPKSPSGKYLWYVESLDTWITEPFSYNSFSNCFFVPKEKKLIKSLKSAIRHIKKWKHKEDLPLIDWQVFFDSPDEKVTITI